MEIQIKSEYKNPLKSDSPNTQDMDKGIIIVNPNIERSAPIVLKRGLSLISKIIFLIYLQLLALQTPELYHLQIK